jgi:pimeloyl-ACP methyl ester carboxylesterase
MSAVTSRDGTRIGYRQYGSGPGVILVMGAMGTAHNYDQLARALAGDFTVYVPDRRGRGMSPREYGTDQSIKKELEDLDSLLAHTGAQRLFGLSSGAVITLEAARVLPSILRASVYEPPFYRQGFPMDLMARFNREVGQTKLAAALVTLGKIVRLGPALLDWVPRPALELATAGVLRAERKNGTGEYASLAQLIPATRFDLKVVSEMDGKIASFAAVTAKILLLGGTRSPAYLRNALAELETILPNVGRTELAGLDHSGPWNRDRGGNPERVAQSLRRFFG